MGLSRSRYIIRIHNHHPMLACKFWIVSENIWSSPLGSTLRMSSFSLECHWSCPNNRLKLSGGSFFGCRTYHELDTGFCWKLSSTKTSKNMRGHAKRTRLFSIKELDLVRQGPEALHGWLEYMLHGCKQKQRVVLCERQRYRYTRLPHAQEKCTRRSSRR